jgi:hypothetical protein
MATLTEMVAAVVLQSSAAAFSHFGVVLDTPQVEASKVTPAAEQRIVARSRRSDRIEKPADRVQKAVTCPEEQRARMMRA